jgi:hypothetical protein
LVLLLADVSVGVTRLFSQSAMTAQSVVLLQHQEMAVAANADLGKPHEVDRHAGRSGRQRCNAPSGREGRFRGIRSVGIFLKLTSLCAGSRWCQQRAVGSIRLVLPAEREVLVPFTGGS